MYLVLLAHTRTRIKIMQVELTRKLLVLSEQINVRWLAGLDMWIKSDKRFSEISCAY